MTQAKFDKAASIVQSLPKDGPIKPSQDDQLIFYKYFKQGTIGDVNVNRPGLLDFVGKAKWDAWNSVKGVSKEEAQKEYVDHFLKVFSKAGDDADAKKYIAEVESA